MIERLDNLIHEIGRLAGRLEALEHAVAGLQRLFTQVVNRKRRGGKNGANGGEWRIPYAKIATLLGLIIIGFLGHLSPGALRSAVRDILPEAVKTLIGG